MISSGMYIKNNTLQMQQQIHFILSFNRKLSKTEVSDHFLLLKFRLVDLRLWTTSFHQPRFPTNPEQKKLFKDRQRQVARPVVMDHQMMIGPLFYRLCDVIMPRKTLLLIFLHSGDFVLRSLHDTPDSAITGVHAPSFQSQSFRFLLRILE